MTKLLSVAEAAEVLGISTGSVYRYTGQKRLKHFKIGTRCLFRNEDLEAFIEEQAVEPIEEATKCRA